MSNEMITSYKESSTKEKLNKKPIKHGHPKKHHTYVSWQERPTATFM